LFGLVVPDTYSKTFTITITFYRIFCFDWGESLAIHFVPPNINGLNSNSNLAEGFRIISNNDSDSSESSNSNRNEHSCIT
jgi:hypothetical protein